MSRKAILGRFLEGRANKDYSHRSLLLNVEIDSTNHFKYKLFNCGAILAEGRSRLSLDPHLKSKIKEFVDELTRLSNAYNNTSVIALQSRLSSFTDDLLPKVISDYLVINKDQYYYLVIEDEDIPVNIPFGILFFPDKTIVECITDKGFFLSEYFTVLRSIASKESELTIESFATLSSDDLLGSLREEKALIDYFNRVKPGIAKAATNISDLSNILSNNNPNCLHFCCHGTLDCRIAAEKMGKMEFIEMDYFNLHRFPDNTLVCLNICLSAYTNYDDQIPRSIANKLLDRNASLVLMTEWPINDTFAFAIGTEFYKRVFEKKTALQAVHYVKQKAVTIEDKLTAITYSLRGNPNLKININ